MAAFDLKKFEEFLKRIDVSFLEKASLDTHNDACSFFESVEGKRDETNCLLWAYLYLLKQFLRRQILTETNGKITEFVGLFRELAENSPVVQKVVFVCVEVDHQVCIGEQAVCGDPDCCGMDDRYKYRKFWNWYFEWSELVKKGFRGKTVLLLSPLECLEFLETRVCLRMRKSQTKSSFRPAYSEVFEKFKKEKNKKI